MNIFGQNGSFVSKLRVRGAGLDAVSTRLGLERLFGAEDFSPAGLSAKSIVCIKKISDPRPATLRLNFMDWRFAESWRNAVSREIERLGGRAFRPLREIVPANAESVVFADHAELLACLASDWTRGALAQNWWWRGLFPNLGAAQNVAKIWLEAAQFVPPALQILAKTRQIVPFVVKLQPPETKELLRTIIRVFNLQKIETALTAPLEKRAKFEVEPAPKIIPKKYFINDADSFVFAGHKPFLGDLIPETAANLSFEQKLFIVVGLLLTTQPKIVRSARFARQIEIYRLANESGKKPSEKIIEKFSDNKTQMQRNKKASAQTLEKSSGVSDQTLKPSKSAKPKLRFIIEKDDEIASEYFEKPEKTGEKSSDFDEKPSAGELKKKTVKPPEISFETDQTEARAEQSAPPKSGEVVKTPDAKTAFENYFEDFETEAEFNFQTRFGGVFYLLNAALYLGFYRDFTESSETEIDLNIWDFLALLSLEFIGERIKSDAVWGFLKAVAECEADDDFGRDFDNFQDWRMPTSWLETFPKNQRWFYGKREKRLVVRHAAGFNVVDATRRGKFKDQLRTETENYRQYFDEIAEAASEPKSWLKNLAEFLEKRLLQALNLETAEGLNAVLFERKATISMTATHLDITFGLADLPFEVRLAGIDRDAGWIPAAGKFVYFHYV